MARRFTAKLSTITKNLVNVMGYMEATTLTISPRNILDPEDVKATITFDRGGVRYVSSCDFWDHYMDNLRAAEQAITWTWKIAESYGVEYMERKGIDDVLRRIFGVLEATPDSDALLLGDGSDNWWEVLSVKQTAGKVAIVNAYKALSLIYHPDMTNGNNEDFIRLKKAYDEGIEVADG